MIRTVVVDDEDVARRGLVKLLEAEPDVEVVGEAADGDEAIALIRERRPDRVSPGCGRWKPRTMAAGSSSSWAAAASA